MDHILRQCAPTVAGGQSIIEMIRGGGTPAFAREFNAQLEANVKELSEVIEEGERFRTEMQRTCRAPYGVTSSCISAEAATVLRKIQTLQNELLVAVGVLPPRGAPAPIGGGGGAPPLLGPHRGESALNKLGGGGERGGKLGFVSKLNERVVNIMSKTRSILNTSTASDREANNLKMQTENLNKEIADVENSLRAEINSSHDMETQDHLYSLRINLDNAMEALGENLERIFSERGMNSSGNQVSVPMPSKFDGTGSVSKYMEWRQSVINFLNFKQCSAEIALKQYKECLTTSEAKEAISELTSVDDVLFTLDRRYYNKSALVSELTNDLTSIQPPGSRPESAATAHISSHWRKPNVLVIRSRWEDVYHASQPTILSPSKEGRNGSAVTQMTVTCPTYAQ